MYIERAREVEEAEAEEERHDDHHHLLASWPSCKLTDGIGPTWKRQAWHEEESHTAGKTKTTDKKRVFTCKTCNRTFSTFQALGGHRTAHNDAPVRRRRRRCCVVTDDDADSVVKKRRAHECSICGSEFAVGQALGGHMRRHRNDDAAETTDVGDRAGALCLDLSLSLSPPDGREGLPNLRLALGV